VYGVRLAGDARVDREPILLLDDVDSLAAVASDGVGYAVLGGRTEGCSGARACGQSVVAARVSGAGVALDPAGIRLNLGVPQQWRPAAFPGRRCSSPRRRSCG